MITFREHGSCALVCSVPQTPPEVVPNKALLDAGTDSFFVRLLVSTLLMSGGGGSPRKHAISLKPSPLCACHIPVSEQ